MCISRIFFQIIIKNKAYKLEYRKCIPAKPVLTFK